ncbi:MAG: hypothetical protein B7Z62_00325 [Deltaproteobacteria bacterium 37-65-8]|nr:MAG: hypothetical protein B7Z62_00325 [Deltaproteobacteria bacterium 37-65-8]
MGERVYMVERNGRYYYSFGGEEYAIGIGPGDLPAGPLTKGLKAVFMRAYKLYSEASIVNRICTMSPSASDSEDYSWMGAVPKIREYLGERQVKDLANFNYNIRNKTWENTLGVRRSDVEDGKLGMVKLRIEQMAQEAARHKEEAVMTYLTNALGSETAAYYCHDGGPFFYGSHPSPSDGSGVQDNKEASALAIATLWVAITRMRSFKDDTGRVLGMAPDLLLVEPCLEQTALELLAVITASAQSAALAKLSIDVEVSSYLYSTGTVANGNWFLCDTKGLVKPVILQDRCAVEFGSLEKDSEQGFMRDEYIYGTRARWNVGSGFWPAIVGNAGAG